MLQPTSGNKFTPTSDLIYSVQLFVIIMVGVGMTVSSQCSYNVVIAITKSGLTCFNEV